MLTQPCWTLTKPSRKSANVTIILMHRHTTIWIYTSQFELFNAPSHCKPNFYWRHQFLMRSVYYGVEQQLGISGALCSFSLTFEGFDGNHWGAYSIFPYSSRYTSWSYSSFTQSEHFQATISFLGPLSRLPLKVFLFLSKKELVICCS